MTFKIAFVDPAPIDYTPDTPRQRSLGGSQSALCHLAEELAAAGLEVTLVNGTAAPAVVRGVRCRPAAAVPVDALRGADAVVVLNGCDPALVTRLRGVLDGGQRLILWTQHAADEPAVKPLEDPALRACWDGIALVSDWQRDAYLAAFALDPARCRVLRNAAAPAFAGLFPVGADILAAKARPPVLAYTSAPFRGLDVLLDAVPLIRAREPGVRVRVFSGLEGYGVPPGRDPYTDLYRRSHATAGVEHVGPLGQEALAAALREASVLAYPNRFPETSCIAVMEALAAGCLVVSSRLGALPETAAGLARLIDVPADPAEHARRFADAVTETLGTLRSDPRGAGGRLRAQVDAAAARTGWAALAAQWRSWLEGMGRAPAGPAAAAPAADGIAANLAGALRQMMAALGAHLNAGARAGAARTADPGWQAEARAMIAAVDATLGLAHTDEETRTGVWAALRGYDAWLAYTMAGLEPAAAGAAVGVAAAAPGPARRRRVYDCFPFHNELDLLEVRLAELAPVVDRFVLVEATFTHAGAPKPLHFAQNRARFAAHADRIVHVVVEDDPGGFAWRREAHQRDAILRGLDGCAPDDLILISDADEILRADSVARLAGEPGDVAGLAAPRLDQFLYFLDRKAPEPWVGAAAASWDLIRRIGANRARYLAKQGIGRAVPDAGWHFTWMGGVERFREKMAAYAHREMIAAFEREPDANRGRLERFYATGTLEAGGVPGLWTGLSPCPVGAGHPAALRERIDHFRRLGWLAPEPEPGPEPAPEPEPDAAALIDAGRAHRAAGRSDRAEAAWRRAAALDPACIDAWHALAEWHLDRPDPAAALAPLARCAALDAAGTFHLFKLAHTLLLLRRFAPAEPALRALVRRDPGEHRAHANLAVALKNLDRMAEAVAAGRRALALAPQEAGILSNIGLALCRLPGREAEAERVLRRAVAVAPDFVDARLNLALAQRTRHRFAEAEEQCRRILDRAPDHAEAHMMRASCLLLRGDLAAGFAEYEWRTRLPGGPAAPEGLDTPAWDGGDPAGRTILVHDEQGLGDAIQFVRYAPLLRRRGARVVVHCADDLVRLFASLPGVDGVTGRSAAPPPHDRHTPLLGLPHRLGTTAATVPAAIPYLAAEPGLVARWRDRLGPPPPGARLRIGLVWAGNPEFRDDARRSPGLEALLPLLAVAGVATVLLQKGAARRDLERLRTPLSAAVRDVGAALDDLADTAAVMEGLDLVISSCTAPAHLAGALGRPVWTILPSACDWRWGAAGVRTPWYPTMRLFRQPRPGDWSPVVAAVRQALVGEVGAR